MCFCGVDIYCEGLMRGGKFVVRTENYKRKNPREMR